MKFTTHLGYEQACAYRAPEGSVLVSIRDEADCPRPSCPSYVDRLELAFHDISQPHAASVWQGYEPPNKGHAKQIADFIRKHWDRNIIVHCEAGVSRSAAVAEVCRRLGWAVKHPLVDSTKYANPLLLRYLLAEFPELLPAGAA